MPTDSRAKILEAAFAVLGRDGYENVSIKDIAEEAGVAQGLVHYYFKSKQQLVLAVLFEVCKKMDVWHPAYPAMEYGGLVFLYMGPPDTKPPLLPMRR